MPICLGLHCQIGLQAQIMRPSDTTLILTDSLDSFWIRTDKGIFYDDGYVGINTSKPQFFLDVDGEAGVRRLWITDQYSLPDKHATDKHFLNGLGMWAVPPSGGGGGDCHWQSAFGNGIYYDGGNVGIGTKTANANAKLQVVGNLNVGENPHETIGSNAFVGGINSRATGDNSFAFGNEALASGIESVALGYKVSASGLRSVALGENVMATKRSAFVAGRNSQANGISAVAMGHQSFANGGSSVAIGNYVQTSAGEEFVFGSGAGSENLVNFNPSTLMIGFKSNLPTFFVSSSSGTGTTARIGIGNMTDPQDKLHIKADATETATIRLEPTATTGTFRFAQIYLGTHSISAANNENMVFTTPDTNRHFVFENGNVGIGVANPKSKLVVAGDILLTGNLYDEHGLYMQSPWKIKDDNIYFMKGNVGVGTQNPKSKFEVHGTLSVGYNVNVPQGQNNMIVDGKVGIGTFAPAEALDVIGRIKTSQLQIMEGRYPGYLLLSDVEGNAVWTNPESITNIGPWAMHGDFVFVTGNKKVGIGTAQPQQALDVMGNILLGNNGNIIGNRTSWQPLKIFAGNDENQAYIALHGNSTAAGSIKIYSRGTEGQIEFHNQNLKVLSIKADNTVVFGNPDIACEVFINGELTANQVRVNTGFWWDRVFSPDYALMPLADLRDFIAQNRHLPDIPNEATVLADGIELGEMNGLLLKKIEELTLYLLEQDRKINTLQTELQQIKNAGINN